MSLPIDAKDVFQVFGPNLQQARVLFDTRDQAAKRIIEVAAQVYASGRHLSEQEITVRARQMARNIDKTIARQDQAGAFFEAITFVFYIAHRHWYEVLHKRFSQSVYRAMPEIERADPEFYGLLLVLTSSDSAEAKIRAAQHLYGRLLGTPPVPQGM